MIIDLGCEDQLVGVTSWHPPLTRDVPVIGTLVNPSVEAVLLACPDAVLLSEEDGATQKTGIIKAAGLRLVVLSRNRNFGDITKNYLKLAELLGRRGPGRERLAGYERRLAAMKSRIKTEKKVILLLATEPLVTVGKTSFINAMIKDAGAKNCFGDLVNPYPVINREALVKKDPAVLIVMEKGGKKKLRRLLKPFPLKVIKRRKIFEIAPDSVAYYTPEDYIHGVAALNRIVVGAP